jgi:hypothetical protein
MQKTIKRFRNGSGDGIYVYGYHIIKEHVDIDQLIEHEQASRTKKPWWNYGKSATVCFVPRDKESLHTTACLQYGCGRNIADL